MRTAEERGWKLHGYQETARDYLASHDRAGLFLDMGLGKTASSLSALSPVHLPALVLAPKRVAEQVWPTEAAIWRPDLRVRLAAGSPRARAEALADETADLVVLGRDNSRDALGAPRARQPFRTLIIDELSGYKSRASIRWKTARKIIKNHDIPHVWGLTGTPSPNGLLDLWAQIALLDNGERLGKTLTAYRNRYFFPGRQLPNGIITEWLLHEGSDEKIHSLLEDLCLSMSTEGRIDLPPVTENHIRVELPPKVRTAYRAMSNDLVADIRDVYGVDALHSASNAAVMTSKLSQISAGFMYADIELGEISHGGRHTVLHDEKVKAVQEVVEGTGSPVLVFYRFGVEREMLLAGVPGARDVKEPGVIDDWNAGKVPVMIAHPASAGHGLNLQYGGHTIVWTTLPPWNLEEWEQANKRLARQGQKNPVVIHVVMADNTIDAVIRAGLDDKAAVQSSLLSHLEIL